MEEFTTTYNRKSSSAKISEVIINHISNVEITRYSALFILDTTCNLINIFFHSVQRQSYNELFMIKSVCCIDLPPHIFRTYITQLFKNAFQ